MWTFLATLNAGAQTFAGSLWVELKAKPEALPSHRLFRRSSGPMILMRQLVNESQLGDRLRG
jgi:hypothetical protein